MPGLVSPSERPSLRISVPGSMDSQIRRNGDLSELRNARTRSPTPKKPLSPSPSSSSRAKPSSDRSSPIGKRRGSPATDKPIVDESSLDNPDLGPFLLKLARDTIASGEGPTKALEFALRACKSFERCAAEGQEPSLELAMSLHVTAAIYCSLGRYGEALPLLEQAVTIPDVVRGPDHALAAFSGYMQLGDTHSMLGHIDQSIGCYARGLEIQIQALGDSDPRVAETCRYLAEAHVQAMQFDEAEKLCQKTLEIHREHSAPASIEEAADRRLMAIICDAKGDYDAALEHLVLASMAMIANGHEGEVASVDLSIGNTYLALGRYDEAVFSYQKALTVFKSTKGDNHTAVALVFVRLADLYYRTGKLRESRSYCENALRIYAKPVPGTAPEDIAGGLVEIASLYEALEEPEEALKLLQKALKLLEDIPGQSSMVAGIEAQVGVMHYIVGRYGEARNSFESAVAKLRAIGEKKSAFFGMLLNQMGLACVQLFKISEAALLFEESKAILEQEHGVDHLDTLGVYSNLAATYDAMGRVEEAIELLEHVLKAREERLGTANPDVEEERRRLAELLKEAGRSRNRKQKSLENLIVSTSQRMKKEVTKRWPSLGFKS
ncbi:hypothetical protein HPP92_021496 [Vanilla planifolia]|uniref:Kinesin light chain n=1 Tax=Vanilla planifolia TaxID=51239 RepID=A0A835UFK1_VANPL|nr:hypothetical protein HPP92_021496 [Vanilla planifolia]